MDHNMNVNRAEMAKGAKQVDDHAQLIHKIQIRLNDQIRELMVRWTGNAATAFLRAYEGFDEKFREVNFQLDRIHSELVSSHQEYETKEDEHTSTARQIDSALNDN